jgi:hypothetical protein
VTYLWQRAFAEPRMPVVLGMLPDGDFRPFTDQVCAETVRFENQ